MSLSAKNDRAAVARASERVGAAAKQARVGKGLTQARAAERSGLDLRFWQKMEGGELSNPTLLTLMRVAAGLDVTVADLLRDLGALVRGASEGTEADVPCDGSFQLVFKDAPLPVQCPRCGALVGVRKVEGGRLAVAFHNLVAVPASPARAHGAVAGNGGAVPAT